MGFDLDAALARTIELEASDLHLKVPARPRVRIAGELKDLPGYEPLTPADTAEVRDRVLRSEVKRRQYDERGSADLSHHTAEGRFRVAAFTQRGSASFVFRAIPEAPDAQSLGLPNVITSWADALRGLVVVTGPTGSGKSTTCAAVLDLINRRRACHILTIEDPIEYLHTDDHALICQREIGTDAPDYHEALRAALRQDPDVVLIGEVRDEQTAMTALRAAETGHLVLCTMHTINAAETVQRFIDLFGESRALLARQMLAGTLVGIASQRLIPAVDGRLTLNAEVLVNTSRIRDLIADGAPQKEVQQAVAEGDYYGMRTFDQCLLGLLRSGRVTREQAMAFATSPHDFKLMLVSSGVDRVGEGSAATEPRAPVY
jgi:twitching motility protein PilT